MPVAVVVVFVVVVIAFSMHSRARRRLERLQDHDLSRHDATDRAVGKSWWMRWGG